MSLNLDKSTWKRVALGDVARASKERIDPNEADVKRYIAGEHMDSDDLKINRWGNVGDGYLGPAFHRRFRTGQVLYGSRRTYLRKVAVAEFDGVTANTTFVVETRDPTVLMQEFLPFVMTAEPFHAFAIQESKGSVNPYVNWSDIEKYEFDLPPLDEQQRLADLLWAIERHRLALIARLDAVVAAIDVELRTWWLSADRRSVGEIGPCVTGSTPSKANVEYWSSHDVPFYTPSEIGSDTMSEAKQRVSEAGAKSGRMLPSNSVGVACIGGDLGKSAVVAEAGISNQQITSVTNLEGPDAYLLQALLAHPEGRAALAARETTTIVRKLNKSDLMKVKVPWPSERSSMRALIATRRTAVREASTDLAALRVVMQSLSYEIFGGDA